MLKQEILQIVNEVADLVSNFFSIQNYSGIGDSIPHRIAQALKERSLICPRCSGIGKFNKSDCTICEGLGFIPFTINSLKRK